LTPPTAEPSIPLQKATASPFTVTGLIPGVAYRFQVQASTTVGLAAKSTRSNAVTVTTVPGAPLIGVATAGNGAASVAFTAPVDTGGLPITSYIATCGGVTGSGMSSPVSVVGLLNGGAGQCTVAAVNAAGTGASSSASNVIQPRDTVPALPILVTAFNSTNGIYILVQAPIAQGSTAVSDLSR
jgi:hypothetical protein